MHEVTHKVTAATAITGYGCAGGCGSGSSAPGSCAVSTPERDAEAALLNAGEPVASGGARGRTLVLGVGNTQAGDDAFGPAVLRELAEGFAESGPPAGVELADGGILGIDLLSELEDIDRLILVDAIRPAAVAGADRPAHADHPADAIRPAETDGGSAGALEGMGKRGREPAAGAAAHWGARPDPVPGEVVVFRLGEVELADPDPRFSLHDLSFGGCLRLASLLGLRLPDVRVVGLVLPAAPESVAEGAPLSAIARQAVAEAVRAVRLLLPC